MPHPLHVHGSTDEQHYYAAQAVEPSGTSLSDCNLLHTSSLHAPLLRYTLTRLFHSPVRTFIFNAYASDGPAAGC
jgi:hypothetical protein